MVAFTPFTTLLTAEKEELVHGLFNVIFRMTSGPFSQLSGRGSYGHSEFTSLFIIDLS
jgi:hypothetical protein